jgi:hypothetical protein
MPFAFVLSHSPEVDNLISEELDWENGVIEDCKIVIRNYTLELTYSPVIDSAEFVRIIRD